MTVMPRRRFWILILIVFSTVQLSAQVFRDAKPSLTIECPAEAVGAGEKVRLTATLKPAFENVTFNWSVSNGTIVGGQGTPTIEIQIPEDAAGQINARLDLDGNIYFEPVNADCGFSVREKPQARLITEGGIFSPSDELQHIDGFLAEFEQALQNDPSAQGYVIYHTRKNKPAQARSTRKAVEQWAKKRKFTERIVFVDGGAAEKTLFRYYLVPAGAAPPRP